MTCLSSAILWAFSTSRILSRTVWSANLLSESVNFLSHSSIWSCKVNHGINSKTKTWKQLTCCSFICLLLSSNSPLRLFTVAVCLFNWLRANWVCVSSSITFNLSSFNSAKLATSLSLMKQNNYWIEINLCFTGLPHLVLISSSSSFAAFAAFVSSSDPRN